MKNRFDWHTGEMEDDVEEPTAPGRPGRVAGPLLFVIAAALIAGSMVAAWFVGRDQLSRSENRLKERVQGIVDLEHQAFKAGDGELFFSVQSHDPAWLSAQLLPYNQVASRAGLEVTRVRSHGEFVWANVSWADGDQTWQRAAFFEWQDNQLVHVPTDPDYWGTRSRVRFEWGDLVIQEVDAPWSSAIGAVVADLVKRNCSDGCPSGRRPFTLVLAADYAGTAAPNEVRVPSPRLLALTEAGRPGLPFWQLVAREIEAYLQPAEIRFAVPPAGARDGAFVIDYQALAAQFMQANPHITLEVIELRELPEDPVSLASDYDGMAMPPTEAMLTAGLVHDLSDYINSDPGFDQADFYEQIWQGAVWRGRTWFMPHAASMQVVFYDKRAYRQAGLPEPSLRWTWDEMGQDVLDLVSAQPAVEDITWGYLDTALDSLYSYAYNWKNECTEDITVLCRTPLQPTSVAAALDWYRRMIREHEVMPDVTSLTALERFSFLLNSQTARRKAAIWVDRPVNYELQLLLANIGVVPFPGSDRFDGITPLWVSGSFISQESRHPRAMWEWLKFLSYQRPWPRLIPARPSVADGIDYWRVLPRPLGNVMRTAFPFARPVTISERATLSWEQLSLMMEQNLPAVEAAQHMPEIRWFR